MGGWRRVRTLTILLAAALLCAPGDALGAEAEPVPRPKADKVETHLKLDADRSGELEVAIETVIQGVATPERVESLLNDSLAGEELLSSGLGLFAPGTFPEPVLRRIEDGTFVAVSTEHVPNASAFPGLSPEVVLVLSPFELELADGLQLRTAPLSGTREVSWTVDAELDRLDVTGARPAPVSFSVDGESTVLEWKLPREEGIALSLDPPWGVTFVAESTDRSLNVLRGALSVVLATLFLPILFLLLRRRDLGEGGALPVLRHQVKALLAALGLGLATILAGWAASEWDYFELPGLLRLAVWVSQSLCAVAAAGFVFVAGRSREDRGLAVTLTAVAAIAVVAGPALAELGPLYSGEGPRSRIGSFAAATVGALLAVYLIVNGLLRTFVTWLGRGTRRPGITPKAATRTALAGALITLALAGANLANYSRFGEDLIDEAGILFPFTAINGLLSALQLLPLAVLPGVLWVLEGSADGSPFLSRVRGLWLLALALYLFFVITQVGGFFGFGSPGSLLIAALALLVIAKARRVRLDEVDDGLRERNPREPAAGSPLISHRRELIDRALLVERMQRLRGVEHQKYAKSEEGGEAFVAYRERLSQLDDSESYLQTGSGPAGPGPYAAMRGLVRLRFPKKPPIIYPALGCGPGDDWQENGRIALRYGAFIAIAPIAYVLFVVVKHDLGSVFDPSYGFEMLPVLALVGGEVALYAVAAYSFGCLFAWLPWGNGALKGFLFSLPLIAAFGLQELCPLYSGQSEWAFRCVEVVAFLSLLGVLMDRRTVRDAGLRGRDLLALYQIRSLRFGIANLAPLLLSAFAIYQQIRAGNPQGAVEEALRSGPALVSGATDEE